MHKKVLYAALLGVVIFFVAAIGLTGIPKTAYACTNPGSLPAGFTNPCPVFDAEPTQVAQSGSVAVTVTPTVAKQYINQTFYLFNGTSWQSFPLNGTFKKGYTTGTATYTLTSSQLSQLPPGTIYLAEWDWTWDATQSCFVGPGSTQCNQGSWRLQAFILTGSGGGGGCAPGPYQYCAVTSTSESLIFLGRNNTTPDGVYHPLDIAPDMSTNGNGLYGVNKCVTDPDFGSKICRATDYSLGTGFNVGSAGGGGLWSADGSAFMVNNLGGLNRLFAFSNDSNMVSTMTDIGGAVAGGDSTHFASGRVAFSDVNPNILYELIVNSSPTFIQLNTVTLTRGPDPSQWTISHTKLFNFVTDSPNCLPADFSPNWAGSFNISAGDQAFQFAFSDHGQNGSRGVDKKGVNHPYGATLVASFTPGKGCRVLNTYGDANGNGPMTIRGDWGATGPVTNGAGMPLGQSGGAPLPDTMYLHESAPKPDSTYSSLGGSLSNPADPSSTYACYGINPTGLCESYTWESATTNIRPNRPVGHNADGYLFRYSGQFGTAFTYHDPWTRVGNLLTQRIPVDEHTSYNNDGSQDYQPVFYSGQNVCGQAPGIQGSGTCDPQYTAAYYDEIIAAENQVANPSAQHCNYGNGPTACVYRFAHTFNTGTNWNFATQNAIANVSPSGKFLLFASDWNLTLGCTNGQSTGCLDNIAASTNNICNSPGANACQRGDVFVVQLQ
jgi:hypothetical protein